MLFALEGPDANLVNGTDGELAEVCNNFVIGMWMNFFVSHRDKMSADQVSRWMAELAKPTKCEYYGYPHVLAVVGDDIADMFDNIQMRLSVLKSVDAVDQYGRKQPNERMRVMQAIHRKSMEGKMSSSDEEGSVRREEETDSEDVDVCDSEIEALPIVALPMEVTEKERKREFWDVVMGIEGKGFVQ